MRKSKADQILEAAAEHSRSLQILDLERKARAAASLLADEKARTKALLEQLELREGQLDLIAAMREAPQVKWKTRRKNERSTGTAGFLWSDWHVDEKVTLETTEGLNEWNPEIADKSIQALVDNSLNLLEMERKLVSLPRAFLWLGGDFISGSIHEELEITNTMSPDGAISWVRSRIREGIRRLLDDGKFEELVIVCSFGNHGRRTKKPQPKREWDVSSEWWMCHDLSKEDWGGRVTWINSKSYRTTIPIEDLLCGFEHGHKNKYSEGIGGPLIPINRKLGRLNSSKETRSDLNFMGHFHQEGQLGSVVMNASLIGMAEYVSGRVGYAPPSQTFVALDKGRLTLRRWVKVR